MNNSKTLTIRLSETDIKKLEYLSKKYKKNKSEIIRDLINSEEEKLKGNPTAKKLLKQLQQINETIKDFQ